MRFVTGPLRRYPPKPINPADPSTSAVAESGAGMPFLDAKRTNGVSVSAKRNAKTTGIKKSRPKNSAYIASIMKMPLVAFPLLAISTLFGSSVGTVSPLSGVFVCNSFPRSANSINVNAREQFQFQRDALANSSRHNLSGIISGYRALLSSEPPRRRP